MTPVLLFHPEIIERALAERWFRMPTDDERERWPGVLAMGASEFAGVPIFETKPIGHRAPKPS